MSEKLSNGPERDAALAAFYRTAAREEPPAASDDAIRAAARRAVASRPRPAGSPFIRGWRLPLSVAAVIVLSVSLVTLMREESPQIAQRPNLDLTRQSAADRRSAESASAGREHVPSIAGTLGSMEKKSSGLGLKPSSSSGLGMRRDAESIASVTQLRKPAGVDRIEAQEPSAPPGRPAPAEAFSGVQQDSRIAAPFAQPRQSANAESRRDAVPPRESKGSAVASTEAGAPAKLEADSSVREPERARIQAMPAAPPVRPAPFPAAKPLLPSQNATRAAGAVQANELPPEKWLERIEELRKQGRLDDARASFADFRMRYPNYALPASLKDWAAP